MNGFALMLLVFAAGELFVDDAVVDDIIIIAFGEDMDEEVSAGLMTTEEFEDAETNGFAVAAKTCAFGTESFWSFSLSVLISSSFSEILRA